MHKAALKKCSIPKIGRNQVKIGQDRQEEKGGFSVLAPLCRKNAADLGWFTRSIDAKTKRPLLFEKPQPYFLNDHF